MYIYIFISSSISAIMESVSALSLHCTSADIVAFLFSRVLVATDIILFDIKPFGWVASLSYWTVHRISCYRMIP